MHPAAREWDAKHGYGDTSFTAKTSAPKKPKPKGRPCDRCGEKVGALPLDGWVRPMDTTARESILT